VLIGKYPNLGGALKGEFSLFKCKPEKYMNLVSGNEAGLNAHFGSGSIYDKEIRLSITREDIDYHSRLLVNAFDEPELVDTMRV
jgi:hypothetical protein